MIWKYFRIKGYIGILDGLGLEELVIPFNKCKNNICVIVGKNGSGKSTLESALSPLPDATACYVPNMTAEKEGVLEIPDGTQYHFRIISACDASGNRKVTKAFISKNGIELNDNGNVSSYKEIIETEFDMDPNFMALTKLSSDDRGLADKKPAERKKYVSNIVSCLATYNGINKALVKKSSIFKSHINSLSSKINSIGDLDTARMNLTGLDNRIASLNSYIGDIQRDMVKCESIVESKDPNGTIQDAYTSIANQVDAINKEIDSINSSIKYRLDKLNVPKEEAKSNLESCQRLIDSKYAEIESENIRLNELINGSEDLSKSINQKTAKLNAMKVDDDDDNLITKISEYQTRVDRQEEILKSCGLYGVEISGEEYLMIFSKLKSYREKVFQIYDKDESVITEALSYINSWVDPCRQIQQDIDVIQKFIHNDENDIKELEQKIAKYNGMLESIKILEDRPDNCKIDSCPFIAKALQDSKEDPYNNIQICNDRIQDNRESIYRSTTKIDELKEAMQVAEMIIYIEKDAYANKSILKKFKESSIFTNQAVFRNRLSNHNSFNEVEDCDKYISLADSIAGYNTNKNILKDLLAQKQVRDSRDSIIAELNTELNELYDRLKDANTKISEYNKSISFNRGLISELENRRSQLEDLCDYLIRLDEKLAEKADLKKQFMDIKNDIASIKDSVDRLNRLRHDMDKANAEIQPLKDNRDQLSYAIKRADEYSIELQEYQSKYNTVETLKKYSSPTSGIQTVYMNLYMNKTLSLANDLLQYLFNGYLTLMPYVINEDEFRIPVRHGNGMISDDISSCSTAQVCMISMVTTISLSLQSSGVFNIFRFDEIDGGLDTDNRLYFFDTLKRMSVELGIQQMIAISHAIESNMSGVDVIKLATPNNMDYDFIGVNVIYDYKN